MDVSNAGLSSTVRPPVDRHTAEVQDIRRHAKDSEIERRELERSEENRQQERREDDRSDHRTSHHQVDILV